MHVLVRAFWAAFEQADSPEERGMRLRVAPLSGGLCRRLSVCPTAL
jgi:hypothetical protein